MEQTTKKTWLKSLREGRQYQKVADTSAALYAGTLLFVDVGAVSPASPPDKNRITHLDAFGFTSASYALAVEPYYVGLVTMDYSDAELTAANHKITIMTDATVEIGALKADTTGLAGAGLPASVTQGLAEISTDTIIQGSARIYLAKEK